MNMKVSMMNVKSKILKLSIILMLILVLIRVVAAEDSSESFFIEYAEESSEDVIVEESYSIEEVEYAQEDTVISNEYDGVEAEYEDPSKYDNPLEESIEDNCDANIEHIECSGEVSQNIQLNEDSNYISSENFADISKDIFENNDCEIATDDISVISQGSFFISENDYNSYVFLISTVLNTETTNYETSSFNRGLTKILELKNNILTNHNVQIVFLNDLIFDVDSDIVGCINKATTDFVFSIDNSVVGDGNEILILCSSCFLKFNPCFYAFISCDFLTVDGFFGCDFIIASKLFYYFAVEHRENDLYPENFHSNLNLIRVSDN